ncbi:MAG TPA: hypothetical protein PKA27_13595 [Fimbriimonadaceae bacterium]|nr:hypothetical protein [Fimbriimonadaceae bacterium]
MFQFAIGLALATVTLACGIEQKPGTLHGSISIGPLSPVQRAGQKEVIPPEMFRQYSVLILSADGKKQLHKLKVSDKGEYSVALAPGKYKVNWSGPAQTYRKGEPLDVTVASEKKTKLDIRIDTGIR